MALSFQRIVRLWILLLPASLLTACGGGGEGDAGNSSGTVETTYTISGTMTGLVGNGLILQNNGSDDIDFSYNRPFRFLTALKDGDGYEATIAAQPSGQHCTVANASGIVEGADITDVTVSCINMSVLRVNVSGLHGSGLVIQNNEDDPLAIAEDGDYSYFVQPGGEYAVSVATQPISGQRCTVNEGAGSVTASETTGVVVVTCAGGRFYVVGGTVSGLAGSGLLLQNNGGDDFAANANSPFEFTTPLYDGDSYEVTIANQPDAQTCTLLRGRGTLASSDISDISVNCGVRINPVVSVAGPKRLRFSWDDIGAGYYKLLKNPDGVSGYTQVGGDITTTNTEEEIAVHLTDWLNASYILQACAFGDACEDTAPFFITPLMLEAIGTIQGEVGESHDSFGCDIALSRDGNTLAIGACSEESNATGIDGDSSDNSLHLAGAVYLFTHSDAEWRQQAYIKASNTDSYDRFGSSLALSANGDTLVVGGPGEDSAATGIGGDQTSNATENSGAVYIFQRSGDTWSQQAYIKASDEDSTGFGFNVALSDDGTTAAVAAVDTEYGTVYLFGRNGATWSQQSYIDGVITFSIGAQFGSSLALSGNGKMLAVGAASAGIPVIDPFADRPYGGMVYLFGLIDSTWRLQAEISASNVSSGDLFGSSLVLSSDGNTLVVGAPGEDSAASGIDSNAERHGRLKAEAVSPR